MTTNTHTGHPGKSRKKEKSKKKTGTREFIQFAMSNRRVFKAITLRNKARIRLALAKVKIAELDHTQDLYFQRREEFNQGMAHFYQGKWYAARGQEGGNDPGLFDQSFTAFKRAANVAGKLHSALDSGSTEPLSLPGIKIESSDSGIVFADDVPLVPDITPVIILKGSSFDMGAQYARQVVDIFGNWILEQQGSREFPVSELEEIRRCEEEHRRHTPELLDFCRGWVEGADECGIPMTYEEVLNLWVGHKPPTDSYLNSEAGIPDLPPLACTAIAAWGRATDDGKLVAAATGDHDLSYQVTIAAWPDDGIPFVYTAFGAAGTLPTVGPNWFFGHPGMNLKGLAYVHHGGGPKLLEPRSCWGYGIRRGASVLHQLRYTENAADARKKEEDWPIGDVGYGDQATVGGFYADDAYGYVIESRKNPIAVREAGLLNETDYLFANNSAVHPEAVKSEWMSKIRDLWQWDTRGGWRPKKPQGMTKSLKMMFDWFRGKLSADVLMARGMMFAYWNSYNRNAFLQKAASRAVGTMNTAFMHRLYRTTGTMPALPWKKAVKHYLKTGEWGQISTAHMSNALVAIMKPSEGLYSLCTGPAAFDAVPISPDFAITIYNERNAYWDLNLKETPEETVERAEILARDLLNQAKQSLEEGSLEGRAQQYCENLLTEIETLLAARDHETANRHDGPEVMGRHIRKFTRCHVLCRQVLNLIKPPLSLLE